MSQENVEVTRKAVDAWNRRDPDLWRSYATPDIEWTPAGPAAVEGIVFSGTADTALKRRLQANPPIF